LFAKGQRSEQGEQSKRALAMKRAEQQRFASRPVWERGVWRWSVQRSN
jgi:hypothetical protein